VGYKIGGLGIGSVIFEPGPFLTTKLVAGYSCPATQDIVAADGDLHHIYAAPLKCGQT
jgi:hypothetical protein